MYLSQKKQIDDLLATVSDQVGGTLKTVTQKVPKYSDLKEE